ncbi:MAG: AAA family ATPase [Deltaproteobacteria bacterium]|nr:AAA family ATPase [Deltaproteobacteria bacterium]
MSRFRHGSGHDNDICVKVRGSQYQTAEDQGGGNAWMDYYQAFFTYRGMISSFYLSYSTLKSAMVALGFTEFMEAIDKSGLKIAESLRGANNPNDVLDALNDNLDKFSRPELVTLFEVLAEALFSHSEDAAEAKDRSEFEAKFRRLTELLGLTEPEIRLASLLMTFKVCDPLDDYIVDDCEAFMWLNRDLLASILGITLDEMRSIINGRLMSLDMVDIDDRGRLTENFYSCLESGMEAETRTGLVQAPAPLLEESDFFVDSSTLSLVKDLLSSTSPDPVHLLFYGPSGTGKTQFARTIAASIGGMAFEIVPEPSVNRHRAHVMVGHSLARFNQGRILIIDEADRILGRSFDSLWSILRSEEPGDNQKSWLDHLMEMPGAKSVWIVNDHQGISQSVIRRFAFSLQFPKLGLKERRRIWSRTRQELEGAEEALLGDQDILELSAAYDVSPGVISQSYRAGLRSSPKNGEELVRRVRMGILAHQSLSGQPNRVVKVDPRYCLEGLATNPSPTKTLGTLLRWQEANQGLGSDRRQGLRMLFCGIPGSGKTEFAHFLARSLDIELVHGRISELISPYIGQSEINLAALFREAEAKGALLLFDEVESFLYDRSKAVRIYEMSLVNELLLCLEKFTSVFVGSTNRADLLDSASRRRFTHTVEFGSLGPAGRAQLFEAFIEPISEERLTQGQREYLEALPPLTPGDFAKVSSALRYSPEGPPDNLSAIELLKAEGQFRATAPQDGAETGGSSPSGSSSGGSSGSHLN